MLVAPATSCYWTPSCFSTMATEPTTLPAAAVPAHTASPPLPSTTATTAGNGGLAPRQLKKDPSRNYATNPPSWSIPPPPASSRMLLDVHRAEEPLKVLERVKVGRRAVHSFGRNADVCTHPLDHSSISRQHALLVHSSSGPHIVDLHSSQGTTVNGQKLEAGQPLRLYDEDVIVFGGSSRRYKVTGSGSVRGGEEYNPSTTASHKRSRDDEKDGTSGGDNKRHTSDVKIRASHLLLKHTDSRRPFSHKQSTAITRTPAEARDQLTALRTTLLPYLSQPPQLTPELTAKFTALCTAESDCSSHKAGGDLGRFSADKMQRAFSAAAFALAVGELSDVVETDSGMHLILRTE